MVAEITNIETEIQTLIDRKDAIFYEWIALTKSIAPEIDIENDDTSHQNYKVSRLMEEQREISRKIMELYQKIDEIDEL